MLTTASRPLLRRLLASPARRLGLERLLRAGPYAVLSLTLLAMWGGVAWFAIAYPQQLLNDYRRELAASARAAATQVEAVLQDAESNLRTVDLWLLTRKQGTPLDDASLVQLAETLRGSTNELVDVMLGSTDGHFYRLPARAGQPFALLPSADVVALLQTPEAEGLVLGTPLRLHDGGPLKLPLAVRMSAPSGELSLLLAVIDIPKLAGLLQPYARGEAGAVGLLRSDGIGLVRVPELAGIAGRNLLLASRRSLLQGREGNFITHGSQTDGRSRLVAFDTLDKYQVKVLVGQGLEAALGHHGRQRDAVLILSLLITVVAFLITLALNRMQRLARERDAALAATSDASPLGLFRCDASGALTYANDTYLALHGLSPDELAWGWLDLLPEEERVSAREHWRELVTSGQPLNIVRRMRRRDGEPRLFAVRTAALRVKDKVVGAVGSVDDITERLAQQEAERTLHAIFDQTPDYICQFDARGRMIYLNPAGRCRLGLAGDAELPDWHYCKFLPEKPCDSDNFLAALPPEALEQGHWLGRSTVLDPDGRPVPVGSTLLVHRDAQGEVETISVLLRDISEQVLAQQERERSEAVLKAVAEQAPIMIAVLDLQQRLLFCNRAYEQHFGLRREDWIGRPIVERLDPEEYAANLPLLLGAMEGRSSTVEYRSPGPAPQVLEMRFAPLQLETGAIEGMVWTGRDITHQKAEQARLLDASQTDPLTQLLNRAGFEQRAEEQLALARQHNSQLCLLYLDLDRFKPVNDQYGHPVGDALLRAVAGRLRHALRPQDLAARLGGDEFAVLLPALAAAGDAEAVAAKLVRGIAHPFKIETHEISVGVSVGFCIASGAGAELERMVAQADAKLYEAKRAGRGVYRGGVCE